MSNKMIDYFVDITNKNGLAFGTKAMITGNLIKDKKLYMKFHTIYLQLNTKRKKHDNLNDEIAELLNDIGCYLEENKIIRKEEK